MKAFAFSVALFLILFSSSCRKFEQEKIVSEAIPYTPRNIYPVERLPKYLNRVAVMPTFDYDSSSNALTYSDDIFFKEIAKSGLFEVIPVTSLFCKTNFGKERLSASESLPENFFKLIDDEYGANGVLFIDLHSSKPYRPLSIGVRAKLVDLKSGEFLWAVDETVDGGDASVISAANLYQRSQHVQAISHKTSNSVLHSPRLFSKFVAKTLFQTLPIRWTFEFAYNSILAQIKLS